MLIIFFLLLMLRVGRCTGEQTFELKTVHVGNDVNLTCDRKGSGTLFWIRLVSGNVPQVLGKSHSLENVPRITATEEPGKFILHIEKAKLNDTSVYYCVKVHQRDLIFLKGIDLRVEGPEPDVTAAPTTDPVHPEDPLLCSNLSDSEKKLCPEDKCVCCFRAGAESPLCLNSTKDVHEDDGLSTKKCICSFFKNMTCFDGGISCAVTTCEEMPADTLEPVTDEKSLHSPKDSTVLWLCAALVICLVIIAFLIYSISKLKQKSSYAAVAVALQTNTTADANQSRQTDEDSLIYSAPTFTSRQARCSRAGTSDKKTPEEETIYTDVRTLGLDEQ